MSFLASCIGAIGCLGTAELTESHTLASSKVPKDTVDAFGGMLKKSMGLITLRGTYDSSL